MGKSLRLQRGEISLTHNEKCRHFAPAGSSTQVIARKFIILVSQLGGPGCCDADSCQLEGDAIPHITQDRGGTRAWDSGSWCCPETAELSSKLWSPWTRRVFDCIVIRCRKVRLARNYSFAFFEVSKCLCCFHPRYLCVNGRQAECMHQKSKV